MDAEILFFMTIEDESDFLSFAGKNCDSIEHQNGKSELIVGACTLLFTRAILENDVLYCGKLEIRLGRSGYECNNQEKAKSVFRK